MSQGLEDSVDAGSDSLDAGEEWDVSNVDAPPAKDVPTSLSLDIVFDMLKNERRRRVLHYLKTNEGPFTLGELAEHIAALENDKSVQALSSGERKRVYVGLYQCPLPRMDDAGVIEFDRNRGSVELGPNADQLDEFLDIETAEDAPDWPTYNLAISVIGGALFLGAEFLSPVGWVSTVIVLAVLGAIVASAVLQHRPDDADVSIDHYVRTWLPS